PGPLSRVATSGRRTDHGAPRAPRSLGELTMTTPSSPSPEGTRSRSDNLDSILYFFDVTMDGDWHPAPPGTPRTMDEWRRKMAKRWLECVPPEEPPTAPEPPKSS